MQNINKTFPYPVLSETTDDILNSNFSVDVTQKGEELFFEFSLQNEILEELIKEKKVEYTLHIECSKTRFRKIYTFLENTKKIYIDPKLLKDRVEICSMLIAKEDILNYSSPNFNEDYEGLSFNLKKNSILAYTHDIQMNVENNIDALKSFPSIFMIIPNNDKNAEDMAFELTQSKIKIVLNKRLYDLYKEIKSSIAIQSNLGALFVVPVLTEILASFNSLEETYSDANWYLAISKRLRELNIEPSSELSERAAAISQKILGNTLYESLNTLKGFAISEGETEE